MSAGSFAGLRRRGPRRERIAGMALIRVRTGNAKGKVDRTPYKATIDIAVLASDLTPGGEP